VTADFNNPNSAQFASDSTSSSPLEVLCYLLNSLAGSVKKVILFLNSLVENLSRILLDSYINCTFLHVNNYYRIFIFF